MVWPARGIADRHAILTAPGARFEIEDVVTLKDGTAAATEHELRAFVAARLAAFKVPVRVAFWPETLPRNANGKIMKADLKTVFAQEAVA